MGDQNSCSKDVIWSKVHPGGSDGMTQPSDGPDEKLHVEINLDRSRSTMLPTMLPVEQELQFPGINYRRNNCTFRNKK